MCSYLVPVSHCKDTHNFDKTNNFFKKVKEKGDQVSGLLCPKLTKLLYDPNSSMLPLSDVCLSVALPENTLLILKHL